MNKERILAVADAIENRSIKGLGFNMTRYNASEGLYDHTGQECGTTACIGGWAHSLMYGELAPTRTAFDVGRKAAYWLDLTYDEKSALFYAAGACGEGDKAMGKITDTQAVKVLRHFAETGTVDWMLP